MQTQTCSYAWKGALRRGACVRVTQQDEARLIDHLSLLLVTNCAAAVPTTEQ